MSKISKPYLIKKKNFLTKEVIFKNYFYKKKLK